MLEKNAIDSSSLKAKTIESTGVEMCPQQKSPCVRNCHNLHGDMQKHTHVQERQRIHRAHTLTPVHKYRRLFSTQESRQESETLKSTISRGV